MFIKQFTVTVVLNTRLRGYTGAFLGVIGTYKKGVYNYVR